MGEQAFEAARACVLPLVSLAGLVAVFLLGGADDE